MDGPEEQSLLLCLGDRFCFDVSPSGQGSCLINRSACGDRQSAWAVLPVSSHAARAYAPACLAEWSRGISTQSTELAGVSMKCRGLGAVIKPYERKLSHTSFSSFQFFSPKMWKEDRRATHWSHLNPLKAVLWVHLSGLLMFLCNFFLLPFFCYFLL